MISKKDSNKLFNIPNALRTEPKVEASDINPSTLPSSDQANELIEAARSIEILLFGFSDISADYEKLLDVLIRRANMRDINLDTAKLAKENNVISSALDTLYGKQVDKINYSSYISLLKYGESLGAAHVASSINLDNAFDDIENTLKDKKIINQPVIHALKVIDEAYKDYLKKEDARDLLKGGIIVRSQAENQSAFSAVTEFNKLEKGETIIEVARRDPKEINQDQLNKVEQAVKDCIPCIDRNYGLSEQFKISNLFNLFLDQWIKRYISALKGLLQMKLSILGTYFGRDVCQIINHLTDFHCVPDLRAIFILLKAIIQNFKRLLDVNLSNMGIGFGDPIGAIVTTGLDAIIYILQRLLNVAFSTVDCVLNSMQYQINKLNITSGIDGVIEEFGAESNLATDISLRKFHKTLTGGKNSIEGQIYGFMDQLRKKMKLTFQKDKDILDTFDTIEELSAYISLVQEILTMKEAYGKVADKDFWKKMHKTICATSFTRYPWLEAISDSIFKEEDNDGDNGGGGDGDGDDGDDGEQGHIPDDFTLVDGNEGNVDTGDEYKDLIVIDKSLGDDIFDDDALDIFKDEDFKKILDKLEYNNDIPGYSSIDNDKDDILQYDPSKISNYFDVISQIKGLQNIIGADNLSATDSSVKYLPVIKISFGDCLDANGITGFSNQQIQEWINKVNS